MKHSKTRAALLAIVLLVALAPAASASLEEGQVLLLYNHFDYDSYYTAQYYLKVHPDVVPYDLAIDYTDPKSWPRTCEKYKGAYNINGYYVTAAAFQCWIKDPLYAYITDYNKKNDPDIIAIATTRGIPAAIAEDFVNPCPVPDYEARPPVLPQCPGPDQGQILASVEAQLARLGRTGLESEDNPYFQAINRPFAGFLDTSDCHGGLAYAGQIFLVSRLDSGLAGQTYLTGILNLIDRSLSLSVDQAEVVLVYDGCPCDAGLMVPHARGGDYMRQRGWQVYYDNTDVFLNGTPPCGLGCWMDWDRGTEGMIDDCVELAHVTMGANHYAMCGPKSLVCDSEPACPCYTQLLTNMHPAGLFMSVESFNGWTIHQPFGIEVSQGQVLDVIANGASFTCGYVDEPGGNATVSSWVVLNLYEHGLSWGESIYSGLLLLGKFQTPIGDPLAVVTVRRGTGKGCASKGDLPAFHYPRCNPSWIPGHPCLGDVNGDDKINGVDLGLLYGMWGCTCYEADANGDGIVNGTDLGILLSHWGLAYDVNHDSVVDCDDRAVVVKALGGKFVAGYDFNCDGVLSEADLFFPPIDVNADGTLDCDDVCAVHTHCCDPKLYDPRYDFDCDGDVDTTDVTWIDIMIRMHIPGGCLPCR